MTNDTAGSLPSEDDVARLTDKTCVVGIDASDYDRETYQYNGTFRVDYLQQMLELVDTLGWDEVNLGSIVPPGESDGARLLLVTPDCQKPWRSDQASVGVSGRIDPECDVVGGDGDD
jgi:hypothetical protein